MENLIQEYWDELTVRCPNCNNWPPLTPGIEIVVCDSCGTRILVLCVAYKLSGGKREKH